MCSPTPPGASARRLPCSSAMSRWGPFPAPSPRTATTSTPTCPSSPRWPATTLWCPGSLAPRAGLGAALAGLGAAAGMYGKYWSIFLLLGPGIAALAGRRRAAYFGSPVPWVTIAVGALALAPHVAWLIANDFAPFSYAIVLHRAGSFPSTIGPALGYPAGSLALFGGPLFDAAVRSRGQRASVT